MGIDRVRAQDDDLISKVKELDLMRNQDPGDSALDHVRMSQTVVDHLRAHIGIQG